MEFQSAFVVSQYQIILIFQKRLKTKSVIFQGYETSKLAVLHRAFDYIQCDPSLINGEEGWDTNVSFLPDG